MIQYDHGPPIALAAVAAVPSVYGAPNGSGVLGHDLLLRVPCSGGDFNVAWEPILVLFTNITAANTRLTTLAQINTTVNSGNGPLSMNGTKNNTNELDGEMQVGQMSVIQLEPLREPCIPGRWENSIENGEWLANVRSVWPACR